MLSNSGWTCPRCGRGLAPSIPVCGCIDRGTGVSVSTLTIPTEPPASPGVILHVRCPICGKEVESVLKSETWGESLPGDTGCGNITLNDMAMSNHVSAEHTGEEIIRSLTKHYEAMVDYYPKALAVLRENHGEMLDGVTA